MMAQAGAILMSLGRKPVRQGGNSKKEWACETWLEIIEKSEEMDLPANSPEKPSWATIRLITLKVDEENSPESGKKKRGPSEQDGTLKANMILLCHLKLMT